MKKRSKTMKSHVKDTWKRKAFRTASTSIEMPPRRGILLEKQLHKALVSHDRRDGQRCRARHGAELPGAAAHLLEMAVGHVSWTLADVS